MRIKQSDLTPQLRIIRREQQHALDDAHGLGELLALHQPKLDIVLQPQQHLAVADRRVVFGLELGGAAGRRLEHLAQLGRRADDSGIEGIDDGALALMLEPHQEVPGKRQPGHPPTLRPSAMDVEDAESDGQPLAAIDDPHQIGVLQIVIGRRVALIGIFAEDDLVERCDPLADRARRGDRAGDVAR
jgi:hypothetical protein